MITLNIILNNLEILVLVLTAAYYMGHVGRRLKLKRYVYVLAFAGYYLLTNLLLSVTSTYPMLYYGVNVVIICLIGHFLYNREPAALVYYLIYPILMLACQALIIRVVWAVAGQDIYQGYFLEMANLTISLKIAAEILVTKYLTVLLSRRLVEQVSRKQLLAMCLLPAFSFLYLFTMILVAGSVYIQLYGIGLILLNILAVVVMDFVFLHLIFYVSKANQLDRDMEIFETQNALQFQYYDELEKKYRESRKMIHDMKNHLQAVEHLYTNEEQEKADSYVQDMYHMLNAMGEKYYCKNRMLNIILNEKIQTAKRRGIEGVAEVGEVDLDFMKDIDITTVFANLLDNAMEGAQDAVEKPYLRIRMDRVREFLVIVITNPFLPGRDKKENSKEKHMGLGLENVRQTLEKYQGTLLTEELEGEFRVTVSIPQQA